MILIRLAVYLSSLFHNIVTPEELQNIIASANGWFKNTITDPHAEGYKNDLRCKFVKLCSTWYFQLIVVVLSPFIISEVKSKIEGNDISE